MAVDLKKISLERMEKRMRRQKLLQKEEALLQVPRQPAR